MVSGRARYIIITCLTTIIVHEKTPIQMEKMMRHQKIVGADLPSLKAFLNWYQYFCNNYSVVNKTVKAMKMDQCTAARIVRRGEVRINKRGYVQQGRDKLEKVDDFRKN